jgi:hypothetical protein
VAVWRVEFAVYIEADHFTEAREYGRQLARETARAGGLPTQGFELHTVVAVHRDRSERFPDWLAPSLQPDVVAPEDGR